MLNFKILRIAKFNKQGIKRLTTTLIIAYFLALIVSSSVLKPGMRIADFVVSFLYVLPILLAFSASFWASRRSKAYKKLWRLMAAGMFLWLAGASIIAIYAITLGLANIPSPSIADIFSIAYLPIILGVMFSLGRIRPPFDTEKKQFIVNVLLTTLAMLILCYKFILVPMWQQSPDADLLQKVIGIAYPIYDWVIVTSLLLTSHKLRGLRIEGWLIFIISAFSLAVIGDIAVYLTGNQLNLITTVTMIGMATLIAIAAIDEVTGVYIGTIERQRPKRHDNIDDILMLANNPLPNITIPLLTTAAITIAWLDHSSNHNYEEAFILACMSSAILLLLIYRNHLLVSDNAVLSAKVLRDSLTGLNNHRYLHEVLHRMVVKARNSDKPVSLLIVDIDDFSRVNNAYGHSYGDKVLISIGRIIVSSLRESDEACRLSGDEFGIIMPDTDTYKAYSLAKKLRESINKELCSAFPETETTVTIGVSTYPSLAKDKDDLLHTADGALYWAKIHGKNNVLLYDTKIVKDLSAEERVKRTEEAAMLDLVRSLAKAVDTRDKYTRLHSKRVSTLATRLAKHMKLDDETINKIEIAGILHDVGKIGIPDNILQKPGRLSDDEMAIVKNHPAFSAQIIKSTSLKDIVSAVKAHHERWDGKGYPYGLKGEQIPFEARILALADTFDAMTSDRPYRKGLSISEALNEIARYAGSQFDPRLAKQFLAMFAYRQDDDNDEGQSNKENIEYDKAVSY